MAWRRQELVEEGEQVLVDCTELFRNGTRFDLLVTDRRVAYSRRKAFAVSDAVETISVPLSKVRDARLRKASPWGLWTLGFFLIAIFALYCWALIAGEIDTFHFHTLLILGLGGACFVSGRHRWRLQWRAGEKMHRVKQPVSSDRKARDAMSGAIQRAGELLTLTPLERAFEESGAPPGRQTPPTTPRRQ
jgi:hypothetical protein